METFAFRRVHFQLWKLSLSVGCIFNYGNFCFAAGMFHLRKLSAPDSYVSTVETSAPRRAFSNFGNFRGRAGMFSCVWGFRFQAGTFQPWKHSLSGGYAPICRIPDFGRFFKSEGSRPPFTNRAVDHVGTPPHPSPSPSDCKGWPRRFSLEACVGVMFFDFALSLAERLYSLRIRGTTFPNVVTQISEGIIFLL